MSDSHPDLDQDFIEAQRRRLETMRREARGTQAAAGAEELHLQEEWQEPRDIGDRAAGTSQQDRDDAVQRTEARRLTEIDRALEKIRTGTYGLSDTSSDPIPRERLEAKPEALHTVEEEERQAGGLP